MNKKDYSIDKKYIFNNAKTVAVYGIEPYIENIYNFFKDIGKDILYFIDNSNSGGEFLGLDVISAKEMFQCKQPDIFMIGSGKTDVKLKEEFAKTLIKKGIDECKIFSSFNMWRYGNEYEDEKLDDAYKSVIIEISGSCNAKCPYCAVNSSSQKEKYIKKFLKPGDFEKAINILFERKIIDGNSVIGLYNWGEPLMHPKINEILRILHQNGLSFVLSTNASIMPKLDPLYTSNLSKIIVSMPGFSQNSYNKIHGFKIEKILKNIDKLIDMVGSEKVEISFYVYQFNLREIETAREYFKNKKVRFMPYIAFFNDYKRFVSYSNGTISVKELTAISKDLLLYYIDDFIKLNKNYRCLWPENRLVIDEDLNYVTCCLLPKEHKNYSIGSVENLTKNELHRLKTSQHVCKECMELDITYWVTNILGYDQFIINGIFIQ